MTPKVEAVLAAVQADHDETFGLLADLRTAMSALENHLAAVRVDLAKARQGIGGGQHD